MRSERPHAVPLCCSFRTPHSTFRIAKGAVAQPGERLVCNQEAVGSSPIGSTILRRPPEAGYAECPP